VRTLKACMEGTIAGRNVRRLLQCLDMADWKQVQARIRKAKNSSDPAARLSELYARTRDAMVAFEVGAAMERGERLEEALKWYQTSHQRFRRAEWKKKAAEALTRLGATPAEMPTEMQGDEQVDTSSSIGSRHIEMLPSPAKLEEPPMATPVGWLARDWETPATEEQVTPLADEVPAAIEETLSDVSITGTPDTIPSAENQKRRRRNRRGGRGRQRKSAPTAIAPRRDVPTLQSSAKVETPQTPFVVETEGTEYVPSRPEPRGMAQKYTSSSSPAYVPPSRSRPADPGIASRMALLEALLRRLIAAQDHPLADADEAPAGPGVFILSDSDLVTSYYVEACRTLRIAIGNVMKGKSARSAAGKGDSPMRAQLAEHLDITETKVSQYLKQHCVVRWLQLDEEASHLAHLAIAVLRPPLNAE